MYFKKMPVAVLCKNTVLHLCTIILFLRHKTLNTHAYCTRDYFTAGHLGHRRI